MASVAVLIGTLRVKCRFCFERASLTRKTNRKSQKLFPFVKMIENQVVFIHLKLTIKIPSIWSSYLFTGSRCDIEIPACESGPCQNDAACIDNASAEKYTCICRPGFSGKIVMFLFQNRSFALLCSL